MATVVVSDATFDDEVLKSASPVVVDFWAEWCGPCKMIAPALEEIAVELDRQVKIVKLNVDENPEVAARYGIRTIPTLLMFKGGEIAAQQFGALPKGKLKSWITETVEA
ncbi:MAG: thioredoxin [Hyphomicrobiales bacterium]|nr:thioredoxin [Hyphomicrobiales bacterium]